LRRFYFSDDTLEALRGLTEPNLSDCRRDELVGKLALKLRDGRHEIRSGLEVLEGFGDRDDLSVEAVGEVFYIKSGKLDLRAEIAHQLLARQGRKSTQEFEAIIDKIELLNQKIVSLDNKLGGIILAG
jgi:hypothetical protein